jgi:hypothetical protein
VGYIGYPYALRPTDSEFLFGEQRYGEDRCACQRDVEKAETLKVCALVKCEP